MTDFQLTIETAAIQPPLLRGLYRVVDQLLIAQREAEKQLMATCWMGETGVQGYTARLLADFDLSICAPEIASLLATWKHCPLTDDDRRWAWLWAQLFAKNLHLVAMKYCTDYLPLCEGHLIPPRIQRLHAGRLALEELDGWLDDPMQLIQAGKTPILTASPELAAGVTVNGTVGIRLDYHADRQWLIGELLAAHPQHVVLTDDLPDARELVAECQAAGLNAYLYSEKN